MLKRTIIICFLWLLVVACIEKIEVQYNMKADLLTVDGYIYNQETPKISIAYSRSTGRSTYLAPVKGSVVELYIDGQPLKLTESSDGFYYAPNGVVGMVGKAYQLKFKLPDGRLYESTIEKLTAAPPIDKVYHIFNRDGDLSSTGQFVINSTTDVYLDFQDPANEANYYLWKTTLWEKQDVCLSCTQSLYQVGRGCVAPRVITEDTPSYDYYCERSCWDILFNRDIIVQSDALMNGKKNIGRLIQQVPFYETAGGLMEIQQLSVSATAYRYYDLLRQQSQTTGSLTDTPPAPLVGNVRNIKEPTEAVVGYFGAAGIQRIKYWIDRSKDFGQAKKTNLLGRRAEPEPPSDFRPPLAPCENSYFRTSAKPVGWVGN